MCMGTMVSLTFGCNGKVASTIDKDVLNMVCNTVGGTALFGGRGFFPVQNKHIIQTVTS